MNAGNRENVGRTAPQPLRVLGLFGPSGAGKTTLARLLAWRWPERYEEAPTVSTRAPRPDDAGAYTTVTVAEFERLAHAGEFLARTGIRAFAERRLYAYRRADAERAAARGRIFVAPLERQLTACLRAALGPGELLVVGLLPPGGDRDARLAALRRRMTDRYRDAPGALADRLRNAAEEDLPLLEAAAGMKTAAGAGLAAGASAAFIDHVEITDRAAEETAARIDELARGWFCHDRPL